MILQTPPIMAYMPNTTYVANSDQRTETTKCLEGRAELSDLLRKKIRNEAFTEEDSERIAKCVDERREADKIAIALGVLIIMIVVSVIGLYIWSMW